MTTPSYGTNFRRAEEASNAQGTVAAALQTAIKNAQKNPTKKNLAILAQTGAARAETVANQVKNIQGVVAGIPASVAETNKIIAEVEAAYDAVNAAGAEVVAAGGSFTPIKPKTSAFDAASDAILAQTLKSYGMEGIAQTIAQIRGDYPEISSENLMLLLKNDTRYNTEYNKRFAGNAKLKAAGLPTLDDASYLKAEDEYKKIFTAYGATSLATKDYYATLISNRMDAVDVTNRMNDAYARLQATPEVKKAFQTFYSAATDGDILAAILDPTTQLPVLQRKVAAAEIGGAALKQNLQTSLATATELQGLGVTQAQAQAGYSTIAQALPTYEKLLEISSGKDVKTTDVQAKLEESKLKKTASAIQEEQAAIAREIAQFGGSAGRLASKDRAQGLI
jgi:hypothetical protein